MPPGRHLAGVPVAASSGSTLESTWVDAAGDGRLGIGPGEPLVDRTELGRRSAPRAVLATIAHIADAHVLDASSPARVTFLDRLGPPFQSTFRPQEALTLPVLTGMLGSVRALGPELVIQGGDLIDNAQANELAQALAALRGGEVRPGSGPDGYFGVQSAHNPDDAYYRPDVDEPRHPGLLEAALRPLRSPGAGAPVAPVLGDHDVLVAGELAPTELTRSLAVGGRALWSLPGGVSLPAGFSLSGGTSPPSAPGGPPAASDPPPELPAIDPGVVDAVLRHLLAGPTVPVPADPSRRELSFQEVLEHLAGDAPAAARDAAGAGRLDYVLDLGASLRLIVVDLIGRRGGSDGSVAAGQPDWLEGRLAQARERWVIVVSHQAFNDTRGGDAIFEVLDRAPRVLAALSGHTHHNRIHARRTAAGGYWMISTASLIDHPQQARALRVLTTASGGVAIETWMLDHSDPTGLGAISRQLAYADPDGGRAGRFAGAPHDRNVTLYRDA